MTATQDDTIAELQRANAELRRERDAALAHEATLAEALATRNSEFGERIEYQAATLDVLRAMSASPGDPQPVFDLIVERARDLCGSYGVAMYEFDGTLVHHRAAAGGYSDDPSVREAVETQYPMAPTREWPITRAIVDRQIVRIDDFETEPGLHPRMRSSTIKSGVAVPLMRGDAPIGALAMGSSELGGFSDSQVELLQTFAEQAVIAITSAETYRALQTRTSDLQETLEYQTAISDVLKVISRSTFDLQPVLDTVVETAARLCGAEMAAIARREGDLYRLGAHLGFPADFIADRETRGAFNLGDTVSGRAARDGRIIHVHDVASEPNYPEEPIRIGKQRSSLGVPLLRDNEVIGVMILARQRVEPFTDRQIALVSTFADQAVIAIENTRLITEQREALEQQTATAEVLQVINANPGNLAPVFEAMLQRATHLCGTAIGTFWSYNGEAFEVLASTIGDTGLTTQPGPDTVLWRIAHGESVVQIADVKTELAYRVDAVGEMRTRLAGTRTALAVALRKDETLVGAITTGRPEVRPFTDKQIALLENFAAQAIIAKENARLINEQREALEQQTATAEVLQVISASPGNLVPVFDAMPEKATRLCEAEYGQLGTYGPEGFRGVAAVGLPMESADALSRIGHPPPETVLGQVERTRKTVQMADIWQEPDYAKVFAVNSWLRRVHTALVVPMLKEGELIGVFNIFREEVRPFSDKQIALLENFAAQAVIAMDNARLLTETREALEQQTATAEVLQVINSSPGDLAPVFQTMIDRALQLCGASFGEIGKAQGDMYTTLAVSGMPKEYAKLRLNVTERNGPGTALWSMRQGVDVEHHPDLISTEGYRNNVPARRYLVDVGGARAFLAVALRKDDAVVGVLAIYRRDPGPFSDKQIALLRNFAAQAVIAMENARLLTEQQEVLAAVRIRV